MRLNPDCIRDILLEVECLPDNKHFYRFDPESCQCNLPQYEYLEVTYHLRQCDLCGYLYQPSFFVDNTCIVMDLTPKGHEFLANIREQSIWNKTKDIAKKVGCNSLATLSEIAVNVVSQIVQSYFD